MISNFEIIYGYSLTVGNGELIYKIAGVFYYFNSALNPILYSVMSKRFRRGFADIKINLIRKIFHLPTSQHTSGSGSRKQESPQERPR